MARKTPPPTAHDLGLMEGFPPPEDKLVNAYILQDPPYNRWAFQHMSNVLPTAQISRGTQPISELPRAFRDVGDISFDGADGPLTVAEMLEETYTDGFLVLQDGVVLYESYFNGMTPDTRHLLMSVSKSLTGALAGIFVEQGLLDTTATVARYLPELRETAYGDATIQQVLDMAVAVQFNEDYADPQSEIQRQDRAVGWRAPLPGDILGNYNFIRTLKKSGEHGVAFQYCSADTDVLGWVLETISGVPFTDLLGREIWTKLGVEHDAYSTVDRYGTALPNGGICTTLRDLARFGQMILEQGHFNGQTIVPSGWIHATRYYGDNRQWQNAPRWATFYPNGAYHNKFWHTGDDHRSFFGLGIHGQHLWLDPVSNVVIAKFSSQPEATNDATTINTLQGFAAIGKALA